LAFLKQKPKLNCVESMVKERKNTYPYKTMCLSEMLTMVRSGSFNWSMKTFCHD